MKTETLKISLAQRILDLSDIKLLNKIAQLLDKEHIVGYDVDGNPMTDEAYIEDVHEALHLLKEDKLETYTSDEVKRKIIGE